MMYFTTNGTQILLNVLRYKPPKGDLIQSNAVNMAWKSSQSPSHQHQGDSPHNMGLSIRETLLFVALALLASATITNAQLDYSKSFFLLTGQIEGSVTLSSLTRVASHYPLPPYSKDVAIQALTDVVNSRFLVLSGESLGAQGVNYTVRIQPLYP
jgi:hypothetical protein